MLILKLFYFLVVAIIDLVIFNISASTLVAKEQAFEDCVIILRKFQKDVWTFTSILNEICLKSTMSNDILTAFMDHDFTPERASQLLNQLKIEHAIDSQKVVKMINKYGIKPSSLNSVIVDTHSNNRSEVVKSCTESVNRLSVRYHYNTKSSIENLKTFIETASEHNATIKSNALAIIKKFSNDTNIHSQTNKSLLETLALTYEATLDKLPEANPENSCLTEKDIQQRIENLINNLHLVYIERCVNALNNQPQETCFMGMHNDIIATLDLCHTDVKVNSLTADTLITPKVLEYVLSALEENPNKDAIIENWMEIDDPSREKWLKSIQPKCREEILITFKDTFTEEKINEFTSLDILDSLPVQYANANRLSL